MRIYLLCFFTFLCSIGFSIPYDWGKTGHRATGEIAESYLTPKAKREISKLLDGHGLAFVSTYGDDIKSDEAHKGFSPWHYVNFPFDKKYGEEKPSEYGDLVTGIAKCVEILKAENSSEGEKVFYLKLLVHFIGDVHQPLHVGRKEDRGGNDIQVRWFNEGSNLHRLWDSDMLDYYGMSYSELSKNVDELSPEELFEIQKGDVLDWIHESQGLAKKVYASANVGAKLGYKYMYQYFPIVRSQLQKGGVRLAKLLNEIFE